jgi:hypothetical protein
MSTLPEHSKSTNISVTILRNQFLQMQYIDGGVLQTNPNGLELCTKKINIYAIAEKTP